ncbi:Acyl-CoA N-acyltransferase [Metarhizium album ARSEF 1941]|uniref:Acyl-CoA N-acyltransferase n=1 Tax=Metarhizium album (strain ARSEF 1941) TaxID=1081103 RepID=A0A0B2X065_METAS|nr:Acyl-CoA N-acyltransferase [Metarhizium album ARSEF 1941]KHN99077.1 Acyl-CoA N-acyltransferase [Metarhizium album ARSEF 1941]
MGSRGTVVQPEGTPRSWCRDNFFLTTEKTFLDPKAVNEVFESDLMWWNDPLELSQMRKMLDNCLTLAVFYVPDTEEEMMRNGGRPRHMNKGPDFRMIGLARVVTDYVTFAYLTDVFIIEEFQRRGLASWMMRALKELVDEWPNLRGLMLMTHDKAAARMYQRTLGAVDFDKGPSAGLVMLEMGGNGKKEVPDEH